MQIQLSIDFVWGHGAGISIQRFWTQMQILSLLDRQSFHFESMLVHLYLFKK